MAGSSDQTLGQLSLATKAVIIEQLTECSNKLHDPKSAADIQHDMTRISIAIGNDILPYHEMHRLCEENAGQFVEMNEYLDAIAPHLTKHNFIHRMQYPVGFISRTLGFPMTQIAIGNLPQDIDGCTEAESCGKALITINELSFFNKHGKFIISHLGDLKNTIIHELTHAYDVYRTYLYDQQQYSSLVTRIVNGESPSRQQIICCMLRNTAKIEYNINGMYDYEDSIYHNNLSVELREHRAYWVGNNYFTWLSCANKTLGRRKHAHLVQSNPM